MFVSSFRAFLPFLYLKKKKKLLKKEKKKEKER